MKTAVAYLVLASIIPLALRAETVTIAGDRQPTPPTAEKRIVIQVFGHPNPDTPRGARRDLQPESGTPVAYQRAAATEPAKLVLPLPTDPADVELFQEAVHALNMNATAIERMQAEQVLRAAGDTGLAALAEYGLYHELPSVRARAAELLALLGGQRVLKPLIEALYAAALPTIPPYQVSYVETLAREISRLTEQNFIFNARRSAQAPEVADALVAWWQQNFDRMPPQLGEPALDESDPEYPEQLTTLRTPLLQRREFGGFNLPPEVVSPPQPNTPAEEIYALTFPMIPYTTQLDRNITTSLTPPVIKVAPPERDAPGEFRRSLYEERLRREMETLRSRGQSL